MDDEKPKQRTTKFSRSARNKRIVERVREGFGYDDIAREERLSPQRVRQIATDALEGREALESAIHAHMQVDRVCQAMRVAAKALAQDDLRAVAPFLKALEKLDRYQSLARESAPRGRKLDENDDLAIQDLVRRLTPRGPAERGTEAAAEAAAAPAAPAPASGEGPTPQLPASGEVPPSQAQPSDEAPAVAPAEPSGETPATAPPLAPLPPPAPRPSDPPRLRVRIFPNGEARWERVPEGGFAGRVYD